MSLLAEDLLRLLIDPRSGRPSLDGVRLDRALAGAVLGELALAGRVGRVEGERVAVLDAGTIGQAVLDRALTRLVAARPPLRPADAVRVLLPGLRDELLPGAAGASAVRDELHAVLAGDAVPAGDAPPSARMRALVDLLLAVDSVARALPGVRDRAALVRRARQVTDGDEDWVGDAVRRAVRVALAGRLV